MKIIKNLFLLLSKKEKGQLGILLIMMVISAILEMIGVASILPFISVLIDPNVLETNKYLNAIFLKFKTYVFYSEQEFLYLLGIIVFITVILSLAFKALTTYIQVRFVYMKEFTIGKRLFESYLNQPYSWFITRHSSDLVKNLTSEVQQIMMGGLNPLMELISKSFIVVAIIILLILVNPEIALISGFFMGLSYFIIFSTIKNYIKDIGLKRLTNNNIRFKTVSEGLGGVKEIKVRGLESFFIKLFSKAAKVYAKTQAVSTVLGFLPRYLLEVIAIGGILAIILLNIYQKNTINNLLPVLSLYVFAGYRLLPAFQQVYFSFTQLIFIKPSVDKISNDLKTINSINSNQDRELISFSENIILKKVYFNYPNSKHPTLRDINLNIPAKSRVGVVGTTGSGKTTLIDIILGILSPTKGTLEVDKKNINNQNINSWLRNIGYVPQHIFLSDDTIASNIAFGVEPDLINIERVIEVSKIANLHDFVSNELPEKYLSFIGERGVRLSGGQIQRIGIARALYHKPKILILDEATNALDNQTELAVMDALNNLGNEITIIMIAHRLETIKDCDIIIKIEKGCIVSCGSFEEVFKN